MVNKKMTSCSSRYKPLLFQSQRGMALFVTLVMVVVILLIMAGIAYQQQLDFKRSSQVLISDQVVLLALSGESWAKKILRDDAEDNQSDSLEDDWAQTIPVMPVEGGWLTGCILDLQGRFNLNNLGQITPENFQQQLAEFENATQVQTYLYLLALLELDSTDERAAVIVDWVDVNDEPVAVGGAEDQDYSIEDPPRLAANAPISDLSELVTIKGYSAADLSVMRPYVAALGQNTKINVNTVSREVLLSLLSTYGEYVVDAVLEQRPFENLNEFYEVVDTESGFGDSSVARNRIPANLIDVRSNYFELNARVSLAGIEMGLRSVLYRGGPNEVRTVLRTFEYLPRLELQEGQADPMISACYQAQETEITL